MRDWIPRSGCPIGPADLDPYYRDALTFAEAGNDDFDPVTTVERGMRPMIGGWASDVFDQSNLERFSCPTDFGRRWAKRLGLDPGLRVPLDGHVTESVTTPDGGHLNRLEIRTLSGKAFMLPAGWVILAIGGIETPRLLLASRRHNPNGIGNARGLVGRYYMCHIAGSSGEARFASPSIERST